MGETISPTQRTRLRRLPKRGPFDRETACRILDEGFVCHVGFTVDGQPYVIPTAYARVGDRLYIHGSPGDPSPTASMTTSPRRHMSATRPGAPPRPTWPAILSCIRSCRPLENPPALATNPPARA